MTTVDLLRGFINPGGIDPDRTRAESVWENADVEDLTCLYVVDESPDVKTFILADRGGRNFNFTSGQFITLDLEIDGQKIERSYSISSPPTRPYTLSFTVKRVDGGLVSNWLHDNVHTGDSLRVKAPLGAFGVPDSGEGKYLLLSAGSGITPMMSIIRTLYDLGSDLDLLFINCARRHEDLLFRDELEVMSTRMPKLRILQLLTGNEVSLAAWTGLRGRLSGGLLQVIAPDLLERTILICGPTGYMDTMRHDLTEAGFDMGRYLEESFEMAGIQDSSGIDFPVDPTEGTVSKTGFNITLEKSAVTVSCTPDQTVLDAATSAGVRIPSYCSQGMCGTCKVTMLSGEVEMNHKGGIRPKEIAKGKILTCCSTPLSDLHIDA